jgi:hypothetical protein
MSGCGEETRGSSPAHHTTEYSKKFETVLKYAVQWVPKALASFDGSRYDSVDVSISERVTNNTTLLGGDTPDLALYIETTGVDGIRECDLKCGPVMHYIDNGFSGCLNSGADRYDVSLWLSPRA